MRDQAYTVLVCTDLLRTARKENLHGSNRFSVSAVLERIARSNRAPSHRTEQAETIGWSTAANEELQGLLLVSNRNSRSPSHILHRIEMPVSHSVRMHCRPGRPTMRGSS